MNLYANRKLNGSLQPLQTSLVLYFPHFHPYELRLLFITVPLLWKDHNQGQSYKEALESCLQFQNRSPLSSWLEHSTGELGYNLFWSAGQGTEIGPSMDFQDLNAHPQGHISPNMATPPNPYTKQFHSLVTKNSIIWTHKGQLFFISFIFYSSFPYTISAILVNLPVCTSFIFLEP